VSESTKQSGDASVDSASPQPADAGSELLAELLEASGVAETAPPQAVLRNRVGKLVAWATGRAPRVDFEGNELGPLAARSTIPLDPTTILAAIADERGVLLTFEDGKPHAPIITGLLQPIGDLDEAPELWQDEAETSEGESEGEAEGESIGLSEARVDGKRVEIEAADEIVLRCGEASIVLRRNGRVIIRGTYVETRSRGVNRIKGGSVEIN
jgi:hypothetical protein